MTMAIENFCSNLTDLDVDLAIIEPLELSILGYVRC
jgi:hypothetical protein